MPFLKERTSGIEYIVTLLYFNPKPLHQKTCFFQVSGWIFFTETCTASTFPSPVIRSYHNGSGSACQEKVTFYRAEYFQCPFQTLPYSGELKIKYGCWPTFHNNRLHNAVSPAKHLVCDSKGFCCFPCNATTHFRSIMLS